MRRYMNARTCFTLLLGIYAFGCILAALDYREANGPSGNYDRQRSVANNLPQTASETDRSIHKGDEKRSFTSADDLPSQH